MGVEPVRATVFIFMWRAQPDLASSGGFRSSSSVGPAAAGRMSGGAVLSADPAMFEPQGEL